MPKKHALLTRDISLRTITKCGRFRVTAVSTANVLRDTILRHPYLVLDADADAARDNSSFSYCWDPKVHLPLLGNVVAFTNLIATWMQSEERVHTQFFLPTPPRLPSTAQQDNDGELDVAESFASLICESLALGETRAFVSKNPSDYSNVLKVQRIMYNRTEPVLSATKSPLQFLLPTGSPSSASGSVGAGGDCGFFASSLFVPHAHFFLEQSDGIPTAAFFMSSVDIRRNQANQAQQQQQDHGSDSSAPPELDVTVPYCAGVLLQPIASSAQDGENEIDPYVRAKCRKLEELAAATATFSSSFSSSSPESSLLSALHRRGKEQHLMLQDLLGLVTGDWEGAAACCAKARHIHSSEKSAADSVSSLQLRNLATQFWEEKLESQFPLQLDVESTSRTALDFFCRCSKSNDFTNYLKSLGTVQRALEFMRESGEPESSGMAYTCAYCSNTFVITEETVGKLFAPEVAPQ